MSEGELHLSADRVSFHFTFGVGPLIAIQSLVLHLNGGMMGLEQIFHIHL